MVCVLVLLYAIRHRDTVGSIPFIFLMSSITLWQIGYMLWLISSVPETKVLLDKISYIGVVTIAPAWIAFALQYSGDKKWLSPLRVVLLLIIPLITLILAWTNESHWLIWRDYDFYQYGYILLQHVHYGIGFWVLIAYTYFLLLIGSLLIIKTVLYSSPFYRRQAVLLISGVTLPWIGNALYVFKISNIPGLDFTPFLLGISGILVGIGLYFFRLLSIVPIARKALIEGTDEGLLILDGNNRVVDLNPACRKILNIDTPEVIGEQIINVWKIDPNILSRYIDVMKVNTEVQIDNKDGLKIYSLRIQPLYKDNGIFLGRLVTLHDITDMRRAQMEKNRIQKLETIELMAGGIVHDFNNHISIINGNLKLIEMATKTGKDIFSYIDKIYNASGKAATLTKQLLTFTKGIEPQKELLDLRALIRETAELLLSASPVNYSIDYPEDIWQLKADEDLLEQVFSNLIINADQAMPDGGLLEIQVRNVVSAVNLPETLEPATKYIMIILKDQGIGIPKDQLQKIFDPYFTTKQKGSGLGLAVCHAIIKKHAGYISVKSTIAKGTTFLIYLPAVPS